jgi:hypothetical protein
LRAAPLGVAALVALGLAGQLAWQASRPFAVVDTTVLGTPPRPELLRLATFEEPAAAARLTMLYLQGFDLRNLDYGRLTGWLRAAIDLDPRSAYPLFLAARVFAEAPDEQRTRQMLEFIHEQFLEDPQRRWPWLAHAALLAKHRLKDLALARRYAANVQRHARAADVPLWARQMEVFILEDMNELEAAKIMLGGMLARGDISDPNELRFLKQKLEELERRTAVK